MWVYALITDPDFQSGPVPAVVDFDANIATLREISTYNPLHMSDRAVDHI